jgi:Big-like domain-containing protein
MWIQSFARKTAVLLALTAVPFPGSAQQPAPRSTVATSVVLTLSNPLTIFYGEEVSGYAVVTSSDGTTLSGTVTFYDGAANICTIPVTQTTSCPPSAGAGFAVGSHLLTAAYSGDATHLGSTSNGVPVTVVPDATTVSVTSSANPAGLGQTVMLTAIVRGDHAVPSGQIEFFDGTSQIAVATLSGSGVATAATSGLALGTHSISARYPATRNFNGSTSAVLNQVIQTKSPAATATTLVSNVNPAASGQSVTLTAAVSTQSKSLVPEGTVTLLDGTSVLGTATLNSLGLATFSTASLGSGGHNLSAKYAGDAATAPSASTPLIEQVSGTSGSQSPFTVTIAGAPSVMAGSAVNLLVTVAPRTGSLEPVQLSCAGLPTESACTFGTATLPANGGTTSLQISTMFPHSCEGATTGAQDAGMPFAGPALAGLLLLFVPRRRRRSLKGLLLVLVAAGGMATLMGCGGNCTDLGTRPGDYNIKVVGTSTGAATSSVITKIVLHVTVP